jgi:methionine-rich copper-binding protein CopC
MTDQRRATDDPDRRPRLLVIGLLAVIFSGVLSALAPAAFAHNALVSSNPAAGSVVPQAPTSIELVFDQDVKDFQPRIAITITGHDPVEIIPSINGPTVTADLTSVDLPGSEVADEPVSWRVGYRIVSADGHPVTGLLDFSVGSGPAPTIGGVVPAADSSDQKQPTGTNTPSTTAIWWWVGAAIAIAAAITATLFAALHRRAAAPAGRKGPGPD